jgi:hypothetical protein
MRENNICNEKIFKNMRSCNLHNSLNSLYYGDYIKKGSQIWTCSMHSVNRNACMNIVKNSERKRLLSFRLGRRTNNTRTINFEKSHLIVLTTWLQDGCKCMTKAKVMTKYCLLGCEAVYTGRWLPMFRRIMLHLLQDRKASLSITKLSTFL